MQRDVLIRRCPNALGDGRSPRSTSGRSWLTTTRHPTARKAPRAHLVLGSTTLLATLMGRSFPERWTQLNRRRWVAGTGTSCRSATRRPSYSSEYSKAVDSGGPPTGSPSGWSPFGVGCLSCDRTGPPTRYFHLHLALLSHEVFKLVLCLLWSGIGELKGRSAVPQLGRRVSRSGVRHCRVRG